MNPEGREVNGRVPILFVLKRCMHRFLRFRMGCHKLLRDTGCLLGVPRQDRICLMCQQGVLGDEKHHVFECPALQYLGARHKNLQE